MYVLQRKISKIGWFSNSQKLRLYLADCLIMFWFLHSGARLFHPPGRLTLGIRRMNASPVSSDGFYSRRKAVSLSPLCCCGAVQSPL